jgi:hypothetical protein
MNWQQLAALFIVGLTAMIFLWSRLRRQKAGAGCGGHCGCGTMSSEPPQGSVVFHARKGERPEILVKMK